MSSADRDPRGANGRSWSSRWGSSQLDLAWRSRSSVLIVDPSSAAELLGDAFEPGPVVGPPPSVDGRHVIDLLAVADLAVNELAEYVGVTGVAVGLGGHVDQDLVQGDVAAVAPPRHPSRRVERQRLDGGVRV